MRGTKAEIAARGSYEEVEAWRAADRASDRARDEWWEKLEREAPPCPLCRKERRRVSYFIEDGRRAVYLSYCGGCAKRKSSSARARAYGITVEQLRLIRRRQGGACAICERSGEKLVVDHHHGTGVVRGLLCRSCNSQIAILDRDEALVARAIAYVRGVRR